MTEKELAQSWRDEARKFFREACEDGQKRDMRLVLCSLATQLYDCADRLEAYHNAASEKPRRPRS